MRGRRTVTRVIRDGDKGWTTEDVEVELSAVGTWPTDLLPTALSAASIDAMLELGADASSEFAATLPYWAPFVGRTQLAPHLRRDAMAFEESPGAWVAQQTLLPAAEAYVRRLPAVDATSDDTLSSAASSGSGSARPALITRP